MASSHRRRNSSRCEHHDLPPCLEPLSRLPFHGNHSPQERASKQLFQMDRSPTRHSQSLCLTLQPMARNVTSRPVRRHTFLRSSSIAFCSTSATTGSTSWSASKSTCQVSSFGVRTRFRSRTMKKITSRLFSQSPTRHLLSRTSTGTFKCRTITMLAPQPPHASLPPSRAALPPASAACHFFCQWRFHVATSLHRARGANSNRRKRTRRPSCSQ